MEEHATPLTPDPEGAAHRNTQHAPENGSPADDGGSAHSAGRLRITKSETGPAKDSSEEIDTGVNLVIDLHAKCEEGEHEGGSNRGATGVLQVPDGGWGWMVAIGSFIVNMMVFSESSCFGVLFSGYLLQRGTSSTTTAWIFNVYLLMWFSTMFFVRPLCKEFGQRSVGAAGAALTTLSMLTSAFSPSPSFLFFSFSVLAGVGAGLLVGISFMVVAPYFDKKSGKANTIMVTGAPVAQVTLTPLVRYILHEYGYKGASLLYGAILLHTIIGVMLFHPLKWHMKKTPLQEPSDDAQNGLQTLISKGASAPVSPAKAHHKGTKLEVLNPLTARVKRGDSRHSPLGSHTGSVASMASAISCDVAFGVVASNTRSVASDEPEEETGREEEGVMRRLWVAARRITTSITSDLSMLRYFRVLIISITFMLTQVSFFNLLMMFPFVVQAAGQPLREAAWCLSLLGVCNLVTRLVVSPLTDWSKFNLRHSMIFGYSLRAVAPIVMSISPNLMSFVAAAVVFGVGLGATLSMYTLVIIKFMGMEKLQATNGVIGLVCAAGIPIFGPAIGMIRDLTDSYAVSLRVMAGMEIFSVALWLLLMPAAQVRDARTELKEMEN